MRRPPARILRFFSVCAALVVVAAPAAALQSGAAQTPRATLDTIGMPPLRQPSPFLGSDHWAAIAARRLHAVGLVPQTYEPSATRTPRLVEVAGAFTFAARNAEDEETRTLAGRYLQLLHDEFGSTAFTDADAAFDWTGGTFAHGALGAGYARHTGRVAPGIGYDTLDVWSGARPLDDRRGAFGNVRAYGAANSRIGFGIDVEAGSDDVAVKSAHVVVDAGFVGFWAGRRQIAFGPGYSGTISLGDGNHFTGAGMYFAEGARLPGVLRYLGPIRFEAFLSRVQNGDSIGVSDPYFGAARLSSNLHPRFSLGATRSAMFGGRGAPPISAQRVFRMLIGDPSPERGGAWSNEVFAWDARWRPPLGSLPLLLYYELGQDDASGALYRAPAVVAGFDIAMLPGLPQLGFGVERIYFSAASFKNTIWYRNYALRGSWAHDDRPVGHPIGGHGKGWYAHASLDLLDARLRLLSSASVYDRGSENLLAPERMGRAYGGTIDAHWRLSPALELRVGAGVEDGDGWREGRGRVRLGYLF